MRAASQGSTNRHDTSWREDLLDQAAKRDRSITTGMRDLYVQYDTCVRTIHASGSLRHGLFSGSGQPSDLDLKADANAADDSLSQELKMKQQELGAARSLLRERDEEIEAKLKEVQEKEEAHIALSKKATDMGQENTILGQQNKELKKQMETTQQQLQAKSAEANRLLAELRHLRASSQARSQEVLNEGPPELPTTQQCNRGVSDTELTCIAAASGQSAPLPSSLIAVGTSDGTVVLLDGNRPAKLRRTALVKPSREQSDSVVAVDLFNGLLLAASADQVLRLLNLHAQKVKHTMRGHTGALSACGFLQGGRHAFSASLDRTVKVWDLETGQISRSLPASCPVTGAGVHTSSGVIVAGHIDGSLSVFDPRAVDSATASLSASSVVHEGSAVVGVAVAPDARTIASQAENGTVCLTAVDQMRTLSTLSGLGAVVGPSPPAFSSDGVHVLARSTDSISCWRASDGEKVCSSSAPQTVCVCWDLPHAVTAHRDGQVSLWGASESA